MTKIYRIPTGQVEGNSSNETNTSEIRPYGEIGLFIGDNNKLELLMFDGVRTHRRSKVLNKGTFYGGDADSSDGAGLDTIKLIPDANQHFNDGSYGNDQYLIIEPTYGEPGHVHIRAGGTIDQSTADLFLGGELNNVRISDLGNYVQISADAGGEGATKQWTFDSVGGLTLPAGAEIIGQGGITLWGQGVMSSTAYVSLPSNEDASSTYLTVGNYSSTGVLIQAGTTNPPKNFYFKGSGDLELPGSGKFIDTPTVAEVGTIITVPLNAAGDTVDYVGGASVLEVPTNADTNQVQAGWIITFPDNTQRTVSSTGQAGGYTSIYYNESNPGLGASTYPVTIQSADYAQGSVGTLTVSKAGNITIASNYSVSIVADYTDTNRLWVFDGSDGSLRFPNNAVLDPSDSNIEFRGMNNFNVEAGGVVNIVTDSTGTTHSWQFGDDGLLTFPDTVSNIYTLNPATSGGVSGLNLTGNTRTYIGITGTPNFTWDFRNFGLADYSTDRKPAIMLPGSSWIEEDLTNQSLNLGILGPLLIGSQDKLTLRTNSIDLQNNGFTPLATYEWVFGKDGSLTFPDDTVQTTAYLGITSVAGVSETLVVGGSNMTKDALSVRVVAGVGSTLDVEINYSLAEASATVMGSSTTVSFTQVLTQPLNIFSGEQTLTANNTTWTIINAETLSTIGDSVTAVISDNTFHKIYRVTVMARTLPDVGVPGDAYCTIEVLK